jgi:predicted exporter
MTPQRNKPALMVWLVAMIAAIVVIAHTRFIADLSAFMPKTPSQRQQMLVDQLRDGAISRLVIIGIEGGDAPARAVLSRALKTRLATDAQFSSVQNGDEATQQRDQRYFFDNRYLLSPSVDAARFTPAGMRDGIQGTLDAMSGDAGMLIKRLLARDPTGESLSILEQFLGDAGPQSDHGVWVSRDGKRAILMVQLAQSGLNTDAQATALASIERAFAGIPGRQGDSRLVMSGTSVLSVASRDTIQSDVERLATAGTVLVVLLLLVIYRSLPLLLLGLLPVVSGALSGIACVSLAFGHVHGLTLGFGTTLIGEAVDYSIYLFIQRAGGASPAGFWRTIRLGVLTSITGFAALMCSSFPGLSQLGLYSISGLVAAALVTRYVVPALMPAELKIRDMHHSGLKLEKALDALARLRWLIAAASIAALALIAVDHASIWNRQLTALSSISKTQGALDAELRADLGSNDMRYVASLTAPDEQSALQNAERVQHTFDGLLRRQVIGGYHTPSELLPSLAQQRARQAAIPAPDAARANLARALQGLPLDADRLGGFLSDLERARTQPLLTRNALQGTSASVLFDSMLVHRSHDYLLLMPLKPPGTGPHGDQIDLGAVRAALAADHLGAVTVIDLFEETSGIFDSYTREVALLSALGCLAVVVLLGVACGPRQALRIALPLAAAVLCVIAILHLGGVQLTLLHLVGLLLVVAIGSNYALFFADESEPGTDGESRRQVELSLVVANLATVASFGLLGSSRVPVLAYIGSTVAIGAFLALLFSAMLARARSHAHRS